MNQSMRRAQQILLALLLWTTIAPSPSPAIPRTWIGGNATWTDGTGSANWSPSGEPTVGDDVIFTTAHTVTMGSANHVLALTMSNGIALDTAGFNLTADGTMTLSSGNTQLIVSGSASHLKTYRMEVNSGAVVNLSGGTITIDRDAGNGVLDLNAGAALFGNGTIRLLDATGGLATLMISDGSISAHSLPAIPFTAPPVGMLLITAPSPTARIDLDGVTDATVNIFRNQTLKTTLVHADPFDGTLNLFHNSAFDSSQPFTLGTGSVNVASGAVAESLPNPAVPSDTAYIRGGTFTQNAGILRVSDLDGTLRFDAPFVQLGGTLQADGRVIFNSCSRIGPGAVVQGGGTITIASAGTLAVDHGASMDARIRNEGAFSPGGSSSIAHVAVDEFTQTATGRLHMQLSAATMGDRLIVDGPAGFGGEFRLGRVDPVVPLPGSTYTMIEYLSYSGGTFTLINDTGLAGLGLSASYDPTSFSLTVSALLPGDADLNGRVDARDLYALANHWLKSSNWLGGDFTGDGIVNRLDLTILAQNWQAGAQGPSFAQTAADLGLPATSVPEPTTATALLALLALPRRRRTQGQAAGT